ncbi:MAG: DUF3040 domain-containing protein [Pseudonocardia sp.]
MLSSDDRQRLAGIERRLRAEDPDLVAEFEARIPVPVRRPCSASAPRWLAAAVVVLVALAAMSFLIGLMFAGLMFGGLAVLAHRVRRSGTWPPWNGSGWRRMGR